VVANANCEYELGHCYRKRTQGDPARNIDTAVAHFQAALCGYHIASRTEYQSPSIRSATHRGASSLPCHPSPVATSAARWHSSVFQHRVHHRALRGPPARRPRAPPVRRSVLLGSVRPHRRVTSVDCPPRQRVSCTISMYN
jgi:hypothetical protein